MTNTNSFFFKPEDLPQMSMQQLTELRRTADTVNASHEQFMAISAEIRKRHAVDEQNVILSSAEISNFVTKNIRDQDEDNYPY